jgi:transcriptional regulator with PAS, ATPase and Fis domain
MVGQSPKLVDSLNKARSVANYSINTLIVGETGTGKELLARFIQRNGVRKSNSFIAINCAALTESLFESELFGYEKGAFTNALQSRAGLFEVANGGILFLDEITEIPILLQAKLLRVIEESKIKRVGSTKDINIDVQILSSTNRNIYDAISKGFLREDLYHRIASTVIELPPLRERKEDYSALVNHFYGLYSRLFNKETSELPDEFWNYVNKSEWEGNIREFSNFVKNYVLFGTIQKSEHPPITKALSDREDAFLFMKKNFEELEEAKFWLIEKVLKTYNGNKTQAAKHLGVSYQGLVYLLKRNN